MKKFILDQLLHSPVSDSTLKESVVYDSYSTYLNVKHDNKKLNRTERLIFLRVFKILKKKFRHDNQTELAIKLKAIFNEAQQLKVFEYFSGKESRFNVDTNRYEYVESSEEFIKANFQLAESFLKKIGLSHNILNEYFFNYHDDYYNIQIYHNLNNLRDYILEATPAAIVQMNKRLKLLKKRFKLTSMYN